MRSRFLVFIGEDGQWYWHLTANNNEIICQSEGYTTKQNCLKGIESVKKHAESSKVLVEID